MNPGTRTPPAPEERSLEDIVLNLDDAHKLIELAEKLGATETEVFMIKAVSTDFSIEKDTVKFASSGTEFGMGIRLIKEKHLGFGYCTSPSNAEQAIKNALSTAKLGKTLEFEFIKKDALCEMQSIFDSKILELTVEEGLQSAHQLITASKELDERIIITSGGVGYGGGSIALVTSDGVELGYRGTGIYAGISTLLKDKTVSTGFEFAHARRNDIDYSKIGTLAAELALNGQNPEVVEPGKYPVIFTPEAISELLEFTIIPALYGEQAMKGETFYSKLVGEQVIAPEISFIDDGTLENGINTAPIDDEGTPTNRTILVENGILKRYLFDSISALEFHENSTGNAMRTEGIGGGRSFRALPKTKAQNFMVCGRTKPRDALISELDNGLVIYELLGAHTANPASGVNK